MTTFLDKRAERRVRELNESATATAVAFHEPDKINEHMPVKDDGEKLPGGFVDDWQYDSSG